MKKPELSIVFDSGIEFLDADTFNEVIMAEVELFDRDEFDSICAELETWDIESLRNMQTSMFRFLMLRDGKELKLATNIVLDYCMESTGKTDDFKIFLLTNTIEFIVNMKELHATDAMKSFKQDEEQE